VVQPKVPHPGQAAQGEGRPPHPATVVQPNVPQRRIGTGTGIAPPSRAPGRGWVAQRARNTATMINLNGAQLSKQDELAWCYASMISVIAAYLNAGTTWKPCEIASWAVNQNQFAGYAEGELLDTVCNCCKGSNKRSESCKGAKAVSKLAPVMNHLNITYTSTKGAPLWGKVTTEIDNGHPILLSLVRNDNKPGHVAMIVGYEQIPLVANHPEKGCTPYLIIYDPAAQNTGYSGSLDNGTWTMQVRFDLIDGYYPLANGKWSVGHHHTNFVQAAGLPNAPNWAVYN
jgi:hypothetical protein